MIAAPNQIPQPDYERRDWLRRRHRAIDIVAMVIGWALMSLSAVMTDKWGIWATSLACLGGGFGAFGFVGRILLAPIIVECYAAQDGWRESLEREWKQDEERRAGNAN